MKTSRKIGTATVMVGLLLVGWAVSRLPAEPESESKVASLEREVDRLQGELDRRDRDLRIAQRRVERLDRRALVPVPPVSSVAEVAPGGGGAGSVTVDQGAEKTAADPSASPIQLAGSVVATSAQARLVSTVSLHNVRWEVVDAATTAVRAYHVENRFTSMGKKLGLSEYQVMEMRRAVAERDAAYLNSLRAEVAETADGRPHVKDVVDEDLIAIADDVFGLRLRGTLTAKQEVDWGSQGFGKTFAGTKPRPRVSMPQVLDGGFRLNFVQVGEETKTETDE